ncbi:MAG: thiamine pyrophosphate-dependent enzyme, partial [Syntrophorhabdaceae bacterium]|nr:thiamine pyrophosphate-dependent enzyme [Syntrophorhabdaceae bacterium]
MKTKQEVMIGNYGIAIGLVEAGLELAAAYPGTPSSEILPGIIEFNRRNKLNIYAEWSVNERCSLEVAFGAAMNGKKAVAMMKQVGLNVASPPFLSLIEEKIKGGLVLVVCDDPGPQSSQTEQDTRLLSLLLGVPVFDPASPSEAADIAYYALNYSFEKKVPVIIRPTHRVSHSREPINLYPHGKRKLHIKGGIVNPIKRKKTGASKDKERKKLGIVASGMCFSVVMDVLKEKGLEKDIPVYKVWAIQKEFINNKNIQDLFDFVETMDKVLVIEETDAVVELIIGKAEKVLGRRNGFIPDAGELTYNVIRDVIEKAAADADLLKQRFVPDYSIEDTLKDITIPKRPPKLCAGCPHRATFYAMKKAFPGAIFPGDIGCYTLGISLGAVDTCIDMGGGLTLASGFYEAYRQDNKIIPIMATIGDSTFFHAGLSPLYDAVSKNKRIIIVIMDNGTTAMTGVQPTPQTGVTAQGEKQPPILIEDVVKGMGVS